MFDQIGGLRRLTMTKRGSPSPSYPKDLLDDPLAVLSKGSSDLHEHKLERGYTPLHEHRK